RDGIDAKPVHVIFVQPEQGVRQEKIPHLVAAVIENQGSPVAMLTLSRILVLEERGPVELREPMPILREMAGHPIKNDSDSVDVTGIHERLELLGFAKPARRSKEPDHLVTPRPRERVLHHWKQLDVRVAHL